MILQLGRWTDYVEQARARPYDVDYRGVSLIAVSRSSIFFLYSVASFLTTFLYLINLLFIPQGAFLSNCHHVSPNPGNYASG